MDTSFKSLEQIVQAISDKIPALKKGELELSDIEGLTKNAQELFERLVVLRHKAFEKMADTNQGEVLEKVIEKTPVVEQEKEDFSFDLTENTTNNVESEMLFDFSEPLEEEKVEEEIKPIEKPIEEKEIKGSINDTFQSKNSLNDIFKSAQKKSLADKLKYSPITNLKSYININQKYVFVSKLFSGDNDKYNQEIERLNGCKDGDEARELLSNLSLQLNWDAENENVISFVELVERRYL